MGYFKGIRFCILLDSSGIAKNGIYKIKEKFLRHAITTSR